eukprot:5121590-Pleurochrysis_carterae.AAC.4
MPRRSQKTFLPLSPLYRQKEEASIRRKRPAFCVAAGAARVAATARALSSGGARGVSSRASKLRLRVLSFVPPPLDLRGLFCRPLLRSRIGLDPDNR